MTEPTPLVDGFYWIDSGAAAVVAERRTEPGGLVHWYTPGSEDPFTGDNLIDVLSGPIALPSDPVDEANVHTWLSVCRRLGLDAKRATLEDVDRALAERLAGSTPGGLPRRFVAIAASDARPYALDASGRVWWWTGQGWAPYTDVRLERAPAKPAPRPTPGSGSGEG